MLLTYRFRMKDAHASQLKRWSRAVNFVWNYLCEVQRHEQAWRKKWPSHFTLTNMTSGTSKELGLHADSIGEICRIFVKARNAKRGRPRWRSYKRSLPWVPFKGVNLRHITDDGFRYDGKDFRAWMTRKVTGIPKAGSFSCDARGRWYVNVVCEVEEVAATGSGEVGIDLGLKTLAALSTGETIPNPRHFAQHEAALAIALRANNKRRAQAIHAKIENTRRDFLHKQSTRLVRTYKRIVVGNVNAAGLAKTDMAKSVFDASWSAFRNMLAYKAIRHGCEYVEANERYSTQTCSSCGARGGPKGRKDLRIREWTCSNCGVVHDRDANAARNILGVARHPRADGIAA